jgi:hypothetical protein
MSFSSNAKIGGLASGPLVSRLLPFSILWLAEQFTGADFEALKDLLQHPLCQIAPFMFHGTVVRPVHTHLVSEKLPGCSHAPSGVRFPEVVRNLISSTRHSPMPLRIGETFAAGERARRCTSVARRLRPLA